MYSPFDISFTFVVYENIDITVITIPFKTLS